VVLCTVKNLFFSADYVKINPLNYIPALVDGDVVVSDSLAIILVSLKILLQFIFSPLPSIASR
jgi:hypothetical protein